jgi:hypothetical protein
MPASGVRQAPGPYNVANHLVVVLIVRRQFLPGEHNLWVYTGAKQEDGVNALFTGITTLLPCSHIVPAIQSMGPPDPVDTMLKSLKLLAF